LGARDVRLGPVSKVRRLTSREALLKTDAAAPAYKPSGMAETSTAIRTVFPAIIFMGRNGERLRDANGSENRAKHPAKQLLV
jgi:hypothetical protein